MEELNLFPDTVLQTTQVLIANLDTEGQSQGLTLLAQLRSAGIRTEIYPEANKLKKQLGYADNKHIPYVILIGEDERASNQVSLRNMTSGKQERISYGDIAAFLISVCGASK
jgi:histidyl-tRNA synthetase